MAGRLAEALSRYVPEVLDVTRTPGLTVAVADRRGVLVKLGVGYADAAEQTPMPPDAVMQAGSMSKLYTAVAAMQLFESNPMTIHRQVADALELPIDNPLGGRAVRFEHLLTHQSGLATDTYDAVLGVPVADDKRSAGQQLADHLQKVYRGGRAHEYGRIGKLWTAPVGERYQYSSRGIATVGHWVAKSNPDGYSFEEYVARHIFKPLGMTSSTFEETAVPDDIQRRRATGYSLLPGSIWMPTVPLRSALYPAAGLLTTASDHACFMAALLNGGSLGRGSILDVETVRRMVTPRVSGAFPGEAAGLWAGLGVQMRNLGREDYYFGHGGAFPYGWWGDSRAWPHLGLVAVAFCNRWDLIRFHNTQTTNAAGIVCEFVGKWAAGELPESSEPNPTADQRAAYAAGVLLADRLYGTLGATQRLSEHEVAELARRAVPVPGQDRKWDRAKFVKGFLDCAPFGSDPQSVRHFLRSSAVGVPRHLLDLEALRAGASAPSFPVPMEFFAGQTEANRGATSHIDLIGPDPESDDWPPE